MPLSPDFTDYALELLAGFGRLEAQRMFGGAGLYRDGGVVGLNDNAQVQGVRRMMDVIHTDPRVIATAVQTVGAKGYDGFLMAVVR